VISWHEMHPSFGKAQTRVSYIIRVVGRTRVAVLVGVIPSTGSVQVESGRVLWDIMIPSQERLSELNLM
jgi:hypothetical protein